MTDKELNEDRPCQHICGKLIPCVVVISHLEALKEIKRLGKVIDDMDTEIYLFKQDLNNPKER